MYRTISPIAQPALTNFSVSVADDVNNEPYGCAEGLCVVSVNGPKIKRWLRAFPSVLNETGDRPAIKREYGQFG
ncbi:hypothetical protein DUZ77_20630 [Escherichia coli]|nr:hypothetical protein [Escherichia coli]EEV5586470.1 hypothetical protein [Escherichia coli]EEV5915693.1 hypothetical protein [Escherichia coli]EEV5920295.1 hypothetical protein [Escherichia coli]EEV5938641.1 hypothetical protein [Escherichia coli]